VAHLHSVRQLVDARQHGIAALDAETHVLDGIEAQRLKQQALCAGGGKGVGRRGVSAARLARELPGTVSDWLGSFKMPPLRAAEQRRAV
jgi:hypothetical protein